MGNIKSNDKATAAAGNTCCQGEAPRPAFDLEALQAEVEELRRCPPHYVSCIGTLSVPTFVCDSGGDVRRPTGEGPWDLTLAISGCLPRDQVAAQQAAKDRASVLRCKARGVTQALLRAEQLLVNLKVLESEKREANVLAATRSFRNLPSVGTWLVVRRQPPSSAEACSDEAQSLKAISAELEVAEFNVEHLRFQERSASEEVREAEKSQLPGAGAYDFPFRVGIRFTEAWPQAPPSLVRFQCVFHHALTDDDDAMAQPFYKTLPLQDSRHTLRGVAEAIHQFLVDPLEKWGLPSNPKERSRLEKSVQEQRSASFQRLRTIRKYREQVRHKELFEMPPRWREEWFVPSFWRAYQEGTPEAWRSILIENLPGEVFSFAIFTEAFCQTLVEEIFNFYASGLPARRPNSMNNYGIILNEIGLEPMIHELQRMLQPLGDLLWPGPGSMWDGHHCFIVRYREGEDLGLDMHTDDSDVTFNICLGLDFEGAGLKFCGLMGKANHRKHTYTFEHEKGAAVVHLGRKRHGADDISSGERLNLILWNHSYTYRQSTEYDEPPYVKEEGPPDEVCLSYTHDRDFGAFKEYPSGKEKFKGKGWCPPRPYEYIGFKPDTDKVIMG